MPNGSILIFCLETPEFLVTPPITTSGKTLHHCSPQSILALQAAGNNNRICSPLWRHACRSRRHSNWTRHQAASKWACWLRWRSVDHRSVTQYDWWHCCSPGVFINNSMDENYQRISLNISSFNIENVCPICRKQRSVWVQINSIPVDSNNIDRKREITWDMTPKKNSLTDTGDFFLENSVVRKNFLTNFKQIGQRCFGQLFIFL